MTTPRHISEILPGAIPNLMPTFKEQIIEAGLFPPPEIVAAAAQVSEWAEKHGHRNWCLGGVCDRRFAQMTDAIERDRCATHDAMRRYRDEMERQAARATEALQIANNLAEMGNIGVYDDQLKRLEGQRA